jgi:hypothetical protein
MAEAINTKIALTVDFAIPSPFIFADKADFWAAYDNANDTKTTIETTLIKAAWLRYLKFEDDNSDMDGAVKTISYEINVFHESSFERLDETLTPDDFNKQIKLTNHEHVTAIMALCGEFQGAESIPSLAPSLFAVAETVSLGQNDNSQFGECEFIPGVMGDQTKLECRVRVQLPC